MWLQVLKMKSPNCKASISFCVARFGNRGRLLQLFQAGTICFDLCQAFFQRLFGRGFLLQSAGPRERVKLGGRPQSAEQRLRFRVLQELVFGAPCVHCCTIGCDCSRTSSDCSDGTSTKCVNIQKVLNGYGFMSSSVHLVNGTQTALQTFTELKVCKISSVVFAAQPYPIGIEKLQQAANSAHDNTEACLKPFWDTLYSSGHCIVGPFIAIPQCY